MCHVVTAYQDVSPGPMNGSIFLRWTDEDMQCHSVLTVTGEQDLSMRE